MPLLHLLVFVESPNAEAKRQKCLNKDLKTLKVLRIFEIIKSYHQWRKG